MAGDTLSTLTGFYQTKYRDVLNTDVPRASKVSMMLFNRARRIDLGGTSLNATWAHQTAEGIGFATGSEGGDFPAAGYDSAQNPTLAMCRFFASVRWSGSALKAGTQTRFDGKKLIKKKLTALTEAQKRYLARMMMWNGSAILCQAGSTISATALGYFTIASGGCPVHFFEPGQVLTFRDATSSGTEQLTNAATGGGRVIGIDPNFQSGGATQPRVYCQDLTGAAAGNYIALAGVYDTTVVNGIRNLVDSTGTVQGIDRSLAVNSFFRCTEFDGTGFAMGPSRVDQLRDAVLDVAELRTGDYATTWAGNRKTRRWAALSTIGQVRFPSIDEMVVGTRSIKVNDKDGEKAFLDDPYFIDAELYAICWDKFVIGYPEGEEGGSPIMNGDSPVFQALASTGDGYSDSYLSYSQWSGNVGLDDARCQGKDTGFTSP